EEGAAVRAAGAGGAVPRARVPALPVPGRARPARPAARHDLPGRRVRAGQSAVVLPLEHHAGRRTPRPGPEGAVAAGPGSAGPADAQGPEIDVVPARVCGAVADPAEAGAVVARPDPVPDVHAGAARGDGPREPVILRGARTGRPKYHGPDRRRLYFREWAA